MRSGNKSKHARSKRAFEETVSVVCTGFDNCIAWHTQLMWQKMWNIKQRAFKGSKVQTLPAPGEHRGDFSTPTSRPTASVELCLLLHAQSRPWLHLVRSFELSPLCARPLWRAFSSPRWRTCHPGGCSVCMSEIAKRHRQYHDAAASSTAPFIMMNIFASQISNPLMQVSVHAGKDGLVCYGLRLHGS